MRRMRPVAAIGNAATLRDVLKRSVTLVAIQRAKGIAGEVNVGMAIVIEIRGSYAHAEESGTRAGGGDAGLDHAAQRGAAA